MIRLGGKVFLNDAVGGADIGVSHGDVDDDVYELARKHTEKGFRAAYCPKVSIDEGQRLRDIRDAFAGEDVVIAEVGASNCGVTALSPPTPKTSRCGIRPFQSFSRRSLPVTAESTMPPTFAACTSFHTMCRSCSDT